MTIIINKKTLVKVGLIALACFGIYRLYAYNYNSKLDKQYKIEAELIESNLRRAESLTLVTGKKYYTDEARKEYKEDMYRLRERMDRKRK